MSKIDWEGRAKERSLEHKKSMKRIKELILGRDNWKEKAKKLKNENTLLKKNIAEIKKNIKKAIAE